MNTTSIKQIRSVYHLMDIVRKNGGELVKGICFLDKKILFEVHGFQISSEIDTFIDKCKKYGIIILNIYPSFVLTCSVEEIDHPSLTKNIKNITKRYYNAKNTLIRHKTSINVKIQYFKEMTWRKNQKSFENELNKVELEKFNIYLEYGVGVFKLE